LLRFERIQQRHSGMKLLAQTMINGVCSGYVYMPCMRYTRLSQVPDYAK
jgi:hypothetical protein